MKIRLLGSILGVALTFSAVGFAQTIPRTPDGKPDLSGVWAGGARAIGGQLAGQSAGQTGVVSTLELTRWGLEKFNWNRGPADANAPGVYRGQHVRVEYDPLYHCYPPGLVRLGPPAYIISGGSSGGPMVIGIMQTPGKLVMMYQFRNSVRHIYTDGRQHPEVLEATWMGHSIGRWEGDTLVVDTIRLRDEAWLDTGGHEFSAELHVVERFRRVDADTLEIERTLTDPVAFAKPFTATVSLKLNPKEAVTELDSNVYDCTQFMLRKPAFGEGENGLLGIADHP